MTAYWICFIGMMIGFFFGICFMGILSMSSECSQEEELREFVERRKTDREIAKNLIEGRI